MKVVTCCEESRIDNVYGQDEDCRSDGGPVPQVRGDGEAPDQADRPVYHHAQATKEHRSKPVPVAACKLYVSSMKILPDSVCLERYLLFSN